MAGTADGVGPASLLRSKWRVASGAAQHSGEGGFTERLTGAWRLHRPGVERDHCAVIQGSRVQGTGSILLDSLNKDLQIRSVDRVIGVEIELGIGGALTEQALDQ